LHAVMERKGSIERSDEEDPACFISYYGSWALWEEILTNPVQYAMEIYRS
jgi:hypothetical protein